jgi:hypothetical protein
VFLIDGGTDREFLERVFQKLLVNFTWWLNREDADGKNVFGGGFLGLDNISPIDRSNVPAGASLEQADGTAWTAYHALSMLEISLRLAESDDVYWDMVIKFLEQFVLVARGPGPAGPVRRGGRLLLRLPGVAIGRQHAGQGQVDLGPGPGPGGRAPADQRDAEGRTTRQAVRAASHQMGGERRHPGRRKAPGRGVR